MIPAPANALLALVAAVCAAAFCLLYNYRTTTLPGSALFPAIPNAREHLEAVLASLKFQTAPLWLTLAAGLVCGAAIAFRGPGAPRELLVSAALFLLMGPVSSMPLT